MKRYCHIAVTLAVGLGLASERSPAQTPTPSTTAATSKPAADTTKSANEFYLDYNVPESPAFAVLGVTPSNVFRGTASKPLFVSLLNQVARGERVATGVAIDVAPYAYIGRFKNVEEYQKSGTKRFLANLLASIATVQAPGDTSSVAFAVGMRATVHDSHDLLGDSNFVRAISTALVPKHIECDKVPGTGICAAGSVTRDTTVTIDIKPVYDDARKKIAMKRGYALAIGGALGGTLLNGVPRYDSLTQRVGNAWLGVNRYMGRGQELLASAQWVRDTTHTDHGRAGVAYRLQSASSSISAELAYDNRAGGVLPGLNAELRVIPRVTIVAAVVTDAPTATSDKRIHFRTSVRWSATEGF